MDSSIRLIEEEMNRRENPSEFYTEKDSAWLIEIKKEAEDLWDSLARAHPNNGKGTVVIGEGFLIYFKPRGKRKCRQLFIAYASNNGSLSYEATKDQVAAFLMAKGVKNFEFTYGRMD